MLPGNLAQELTSRCERALRSNLVGHSLVIGRLRFLDVGDRYQANLKALLGLFELSGDGLAVGMDRAQPVFGAEDIEITLRNANDQVLLRSLTNGFGLRASGYALVG